MGKSSRRRKETSWNGSIVKGISLNPNYNSAPLDRFERSNRDCSGGMERALR
jgi:hypothetical protein